MNAMKAFIFLALCLSLSFAAFAEDQKLCPIMAGSEIDVNEVAQYKGKEVYMCCATCVTAWELNPDYYAVAAMSIESEKPPLPQLEGVELPESKLMKQRFCPIRRTVIVCPESPSIEYRGKTVYFFRSSDIRRWNRDPEGNLEKARKAGLLPQFDEEKEERDESAG